MKAFGIFIFRSKKTSPSQWKLWTLSFVPKGWLHLSFPRLFVRIPFPFVPPSCFFDNAVYSLSAPLTMKAFGIFMFGAKNISITMETLDVVLCAERMVTCCVSMIVGGIPFPFVPSSGFFNNALYTLFCSSDHEGLWDLHVSEQKTSPSQWKLRTLSFVPKGW